MLDMGFQPQVDRIVRRLPRNRQTMFFSATLDGEVGELARAYTNNPSRIEGDLSLIAAAGRDRAPLRPGDAGHEGRDARRAHPRSTGSTLVFVRTKRGADRLVQQAGPPRRRRGRDARRHVAESARARARPASRAARSRRSSPPTSPPAGSTSTTSPTSSTTTRPRRTRATSTAPAARAARGAAAPRSRSSSPSSRPTRAASPAGSATASDSRRAECPPPREARLHEPPRAPLEVVTGPRPARAGGGPRGPRRRRRGGGAAPARSASARSRSAHASSQIRSASSIPTGSVVERERIEKSG